MAPTAKPELLLSVEGRLGEILTAYQLPAVSDEEMVAVAQRSAVAEMTEVLVEHVPVEDSNRKSILTGNWAWTVAWNAMAEAAWNRYQSVSIVPAVAPPAP